jgi:hypothetical protein
MPYTPVNDDDENPDPHQYLDPDEAAHPNLAQRIVDPRGQAIKDKVKNMRQALFNNPQLAPTPPMGTQWMHSVRIIRTSGNDQNPAQWQQPASYTTHMKSLPQKNRPQVDQNAQMVKRLLIGFSNQLISTAKKKGQLTGNWKTVVRIVPSADGQNPMPDLGCGCGCS